MTDNKNISEYKVAQITNPTQVIGQKRNVSQLLGAALLVVGVVFVAIFVSIYGVKELGEGLNSYERCGLFFGILAFIIGSLLLSMKLLKQYFFFSVIIFLSCTLVYQSSFTYQIIMEPTIISSPPWKTHLLGERDPVLLTNRSAIVDIGKNGSQKDVFQAIHTYMLDKPCAASGNRSDVSIGSNDPDFSLIGRVLFDKYSITNINIVQEMAYNGDIRTNSHIGAYFWKQSQIENDISLSEKGIPNDTSGNSIYISQLEFNLNESIPKISLGEEFQVFKENNTIKILKNNILSHSISLINQSKMKITRNLKGRFEIAIDSDIVYVLE